MKVLHVIPSVAPRYGGPSLAIFPMCKALQEAGCEVQICTTNADGRQGLPVEIGRMRDYEGIETIFFTSSAGEFKYSHALTRWLNNHVAEFDLIHIHAVFNHPSLAAARVARRLSVPYIVRPLGTLDPWCMGQKAVKKRLFWRAFGKGMIQGAAAVHYTAAAEQQAVEQSLHVDHGVVIPLGVDSEGARPVPSDQHLIPGFDQSTREYVLFLSRLHPKKGLEVLIAAFASLMTDERFKKWKLLVAGDGERQYVESLRALVRKLGITKSVIFSGWLDAESKSAALHGASLLALPSYQENFGVCVVEALSCGVPVLVSPHVNLASEIEKAGAGWIAPVRETALTSTLREVFLSEGERHQRGRSAESLAQNYKWPRVSSEMMNLYRVIVAQFVPSSS